MIRSSAQNKIFHSIMGDFARSFAHEGVRLTAAEWKTLLVVFFPLALAEADGAPIPHATAPESTSKMDVDRMSCLIEYCYFIGTRFGVTFAD